VGPPQLRRLHVEMARAAELLGGGGGGGGAWPWGALLEPFAEKELFAPGGRFEHFVQVDVWAASPDDMARWLGWVESRLRTLLVALEQPPLVTCWPLAHPLKLASATASGSGSGSSCWAFWAALSFHSSVNVFDLTPIVQDFVYRVNVWPERLPDRMHVKVTHVTRAQLPPECLQLQQRRPQANSNSNKRSSADEGGRREDKRSRVEDARP
jgi:poly(A) polymerase